MAEAAEPRSPSQPSLKEVVRPDSMHVSNETWMGVLHLTAVEGKGLRGMDIGGKSDPFMVISFGPFTFRTEVVKNTLDPVWNASCRLAVHTHSMTYVLKLSVYDYDMVSDNDFIGQVELPLAQLNLQSRTEPWDDWFDLTYEQKGRTLVGGRVHMRFHYRPREVLERTFWDGMVRFFDTDGNGLIGQEEFAAMLQTMNPDIDPALMESLFRAADADGDDGVTAAELARVMRDAQGTLAAWKTCPVCQAPLNATCDAEAVSHVGACFESGTSDVSSALMSAFVSEQQASRNVRAHGSDDPLDIRHDPEYVLVMDRVSGAVQTEFVPPSIRMALRSLYGTAAGKFAANTEKVKALLRSLTAKYGRKYTDPKSVAEIAPFIALHKLNTEEILDPLDSFRNFNEFFYRKLKPGARPIEAPADARVLVSGADCRCVVFSTISDATRIWVKGRKFSLAALVDDAELARRFEGGALCILRLAPQDYHRMHAPCAGRVGAPRAVGSEFYTVNPVAVRTPAFDVYTENKRVVTPLHSDAFGTVLYICVGATMVGSINLTVREGQTVQKGDEWGYFGFGGSTVLLLFEPGRVQFDADLLANSARPLETLVRVGQRIGVARS